MKETIRKSSKRINVPDSGQLVRNNFVVFNWDRPLNSLTPEGEILYGVQLEGLSEDQGQSLGDFLSEGRSSNLIDFSDHFDENDLSLKFKLPLEESKTTSNPRRRRNILLSCLPFTRRFRYRSRRQREQEQQPAVISVSMPKPGASQYEKFPPLYRKLLENSPDLHNWVPWTIFTGYGDKLLSLKVVGEEERVELEKKIKGIVLGGEYLSKVREEFPNGYPRKRTEVILERQNKDPKVQGILEAGSNSIDAISKREKIGQFGLGVKQVFEWLEKGEGEVSVLTRKDKGEMLSFRARRGYDGQIYIKFSPPSQDEKSRFGEDNIGTSLSISGITVDPNRRAHIISKIKERFSYVPETDITVNGETINGLEGIKVVGRKEIVDAKGNINITIDEHNIEIRDDGSGMNEEELFRMFLPGHGKGFKTISTSEAQTIAEEQAEVLFVSEDNPRIVLSRNREAVFSVEIPKDRTNTSSKTICLELGRVLKVSEGRDGFEIDNNFEVAISILADKTLRDETLTNEEKTSFLNSLILGIDQLSATYDIDKEDKTAASVRRTKSRVREVALPYMQQLRSENVTLLPSYSSYERVVPSDPTQKIEYVDPYLLEGISDIATLLESEGFTALRNKDGILTKGGWKVLTTELKESEHVQTLFSQAKTSEGLRQLRERLEEVLPVIIDPRHRVVIVDRNTWRLVDEETDSISKSYYRELLQTFLNQKILTSYESEDPRSIFVQNRQEEVSVSRLPSTGDSHTLAHEDEVEDGWSFERSILSKDRDLNLWSSGSELCAIDSSGILRRYDKKTKRLLGTSYIGFLEGERICEFGVSKNGGVWIGTPEEAIHLDKQGNILGKFKTDFRGFSRTQVTKEGEFITANDDRIVSFNPRTGESWSYTIPEGVSVFEDPIITDMGEIMFYKKGKIYKVNSADNSFFLSRDFPLSHGGKEYYNNKYFFGHEGKNYVIGANGVHFVEPRIAIFEIKERDSELLIEHVVDFSNPFGSVKYKYLQDPESGSILMRLGNKVFILNPTEDSFREEHSYKIDFSELSEHDMLLATGALKDLFRDDPYVSYDEAVLALRGRLELSSYSRGDSSTRSSESVNSFLDLIGSSSLRDSFQLVWKFIKENVQVEDLHRLKMRFFRNVPLLLDLDTKEISFNDIELLFYSDNPQIFFQQDEDQREKLASFNEQIDSIEQRESFHKIVGLVLSSITPDRRDLFYEQLGKLFTREKFRNHFLRIINQNDEILTNAVMAPDDLKENDFLRSYIMFLTNNADLIRSKEDELSDDGVWTDILPENVPLELLAHLTLTEGHFMIGEIKDRIGSRRKIDLLLRNTNLYRCQDILRQSIHSQATEAGVDKKEFMQNSKDAIVKKGEDGGYIKVSFYYRNERREYVEEVEDTGIGIEDLVAFLVPGETTKEGTGEQGFFGTGFYKSFGEVDSIEVDTIVQEGNKRQAYRIRIKVTKDDNGVAQGGLMTKIQKKKRSVDAATGTKIKLVKNVEDSLPELEAMIAKNTYKTMGGLAMTPEVSGYNNQLIFVNGEGKDETVRVDVQEISHYEDVPNIVGKVSFVQAHSFPSLLTSGGLRMSSLTSSSDYFASVPTRLKPIFIDERISIVLPTTIPLVKDRSRLAHEEQYLPAIQRVVAAEAVRRAAHLMLSDKSTSVSGFIPEDILTERSYYRKLTSEGGRKSMEISRKISDLVILDEADIAYINQVDDVDRLIMVLIGIEKTGVNGKKDSLLRRFQYIQKKAGNEDLSSGIYSGLGVDISQTEINPKMKKEEQRLIAQVQSNSQNAAIIGRIKEELDQGEKPEMVQSLGETNLELREREILLEFFSGINFDEVYFVPEDLLSGAKGLFDGKRIFLSSKILSKLSRERLETIIHETAHLFEKKALGKNSGSLDTKEDVNSEFTHQQDGAFAQYYKVAALGMLLILKYNSSNK